MDPDNDKIIEFFRMLFNDAISIAKDYKRRAGEQITCRAPCSGLNKWDPRTFISDIIPRLHNSDIINCLLAGRNPVLKESQ
jgi:hypothetical protein